VKHLKALVYHGPNDLRYEDAPKPEPLPRELLVRVKTVGICGSDVHGYMGLTGRRIPPMIMGHEIAGDVVAVGAEVSNFKVGDRVAVDPIICCNECDFCRTGRTNICKSRRVIGVSMQNETINGAMAEYIAIPEHVAIKIPADLSYEQGALVDPLAVSVHGVRMGGDLNNKRVAVIGAGQIGLFAMQAAKAFGAESVTAIDIIDKRLSLAEELGADQSINAKSFTEGGRDLKESCLQFGGFDVVIEAVGVEITVQQAIYLTKSGGTVVLMGLGQKEVKIDAHHVVENEIALRGTYIFVEKDGADAIRLLQEGLVDIGKMVDCVEPLEKGPDLFARLAREDGSLFKVLMIP
jgi:2-desacetyl-2-hydroxyethyl bacteriochlorophyllide A dehydrogenase